MPHTKEGLKMLVPLHNFSYFQSHLITGQFFLNLRLQQMVLQTWELRCSPFISRSLIFADFADSKYFSSLWGIRNELKAVNQKVTLTIFLGLQDATFSAPVLDD